MRAHYSKESVRTALFGLSASFVAALTSIVGRCLRHSFTHFVRGWPGTGLLLIRSLVGLALISHQVPALVNDPLSFSSVISGVLVLAGVLLIIGLWTPVAGILAGVFQIMILFSHPRDPWMYLQCGVFASALAMIGPGGWSVDARLFGWKRLEIPPPTHEPRSGSRE